jgi:aminoglycoside phosphotransferase (APT) family kinase protein
MDALAGWLKAHRLAGEAPTVIHGDYHLDNVMFAWRCRRVVAILDGRPRRRRSARRSASRRPSGPTPAIDLPRQSLARAELGDGIGTRTDLADAYATATGRSLTRLPYYQALALFRLACILEGSWARHQRGAADDPFFAHLERGVPAMAARARALGGA